MHGGKEAGNVAVMESLSSSLVDWEGWAGPGLGWAVKILDFDLVCRGKNKWVESEKLGMVEEVKEVEEMKEVKEVGEVKETKMKEVEMKGVAVDLVAERKEVAAERKGVAVDLVAERKVVLKIEEAVMWEVEMVAHCKCPPYVE